jgi:desulfoferrodoxin-like iron-binding protein
MAAPAAIGTRLTCTECGTEIIVVKAPGGDLSCCGQPMEKK